MDPDVHVLECHPDRGDEGNDAFAKIGGNDWRYVILKKPSLGSVGLRASKNIWRRSPPPWYRFLKRKRNQPLLYLTRVTILDRNKSSVYEFVGVCNEKNIDCR